VSSNRSRQPRRRPVPKGQARYQPSASPTRRSVEQASATPLVFLHQLPVWLPPLVTVALLITGLAVRGPVGAAALCLLAVLLGWLAIVSWPGLSSRGRLGRALAIACVLAVAGLQASR
jgi:uncharacterized protein DUF6703